MKRFTLVLAALLGAAPALAAEPVRIVATLSDVAAITRAIGGDDVAVTALVSPNQDPHQVTPTPALMTAVSNADLFLEIGMSLELWSERVLDGARNPRVRRGAIGHAVVSEGVPALEVPKRITRALGDIHPEGNPHVWTDPLNGLVIARNVRNALARVAPDRAGVWKKGYERFEADLYAALYGPELVKLFGGPLLARLDRGHRLFPFLESKTLDGKPLIAKLGGLHAQARAFRGREIVTHHALWPYFADRFGLTIAGVVEDQPGIAPSARRRDEVTALVREREIAVIASAEVQAARAGRAIAEATGARFVWLPASTGTDESYLDYLGRVVGRLAEAYAPEGGRGSGRK